MNNYCYHNCLCIYTIITLLCIRSHICSFILRFSYIYILHIVISFSIISFCLSYIMNASMHSCIHIFICSFLYPYPFISFIYFYHDLAILVLSIFLSCRLLLIHIFIYVPIIYANVLIPMLCHLLLISIVLIIYAFLLCVPSMFHLIPFGMSIIYSYHLRIPVMSLSFIYFLYSYHVPSIRLCMTIICSQHIILYSYVPIICVL